MVEVVEEQEEEDDDDSRLSDPVVGGIRERHVYERATPVRRRDVRREFIRRNLPHEKARRPDRYYFYNTRCATPS